MWGLNILEAIVLVISVATIIVINVYLLIDKIKTKKWKTKQK
jgi:hypothetical protein